MRRLSTIVIAMLLGLCPAWAGSLLVAPTTLNSGASGEVGILYVTNNGDKPANAQIEAFDWSQAEGQDKLALAGDLLVSPPMAHIPPGGTQVVRVKSTAAGGGSEQAWRLVVSEIPDAQAAPKMGVNILLQFSVPVFAGGKGGAPAAPQESGHLMWDAALAEGGLVLSARNDSSTHVRITDVALSGAHAPAGAKGLFYILPGATRVWRLSLPGLAVGDHLHVEGRELTQPASAADIVVHG